MRLKTLILLSLLATVFGALGYLIVRQGTQTCGWLDRAMGNSGCIGSQSFEGVIPVRRHATAPADVPARIIMSADLRTVDGWRPGLIILDPVSGGEHGRYPIPMRYSDVRIFASPESDQLLLVCGILEQGCSEENGSAVTMDRATLTEFSPYSLGDHYLRAWPGSPQPDAETYGYEALYAADGTRIVAQRRGQPLRLYDNTGTLIAELTEGRYSMRDAVISPDGLLIAVWEPEGAPGGGDLLRVWDSRDGRLLTAINGSPGWRLRSAPFWSENGREIFAPRYGKGMMTLDHFSIQ